MEREEKIQGVIRPREPEFVLQWGKRLRCVRVKNPNFSGKSSGGIRRKITSRIVTDSDPSPSPPQANRLTSVFEASTTIRSATNENRKSASPEKEERYYSTRGSVGGGSGHGGGDENGKLNIVDGVGEEKGGNIVWPKLYITLSSKEKEEDFLAMKGCKLPQRPKKRAKLIQRTLLLVSPGAWLSDMCQERYEVREKKTSKKRPRGLKAMGLLDSDSE
ncbi:hypothetical protein Ancab_013694 [Ancistrocladus abbreviatus]